MKPRSLLALVEKLRVSRIRAVRVCLLPPAALLLLSAAGCASDGGNAGKQPPGNGIVEYKKIASEAADATGEMLAALEGLRQQSNNCPPEVLARFSSELNQMQVESIQIRARSKAMQDLGDNYFANWHQNLARIDDPKRRALVEARRPQLQQSFERIKVLSKQSRDAYEPFVAALRQTRNSLEQDPASISAEPVRTSINRAGETGQQLRVAIADIIGELDSMHAMVTSESEVGRENP